MSGNERQGSMVDHIKHIREKNEKAKASFAPRKNLWLDWHDGDQVVRFVGDFVITRTHWFTPSPYNPLRLFEDKAFEGDNSLPKLGNCGNWEILKENPYEGGCVMCLLNKIARDILKSSASLDLEAKAEFEALKARTDFRAVYRWNVLDREHPNNDDGTITGYKVATLGYELFEEISSLHTEYAPADFSSADEGLDVKINKSGGGGGGGGGRVKYRAQAVFKGASLKVTPLTPEERDLQVVSLADVCGRQIDQDLLRTKLLSKWRDLIESYTQAAHEASPKLTPKAVAAPKAAPKAGSRLAPPAETEENPF